MPPLNQNLSSDLQVPCPLTTSSEKNKARFMLLACYLLNYGISVLDNKKNIDFFKDEYIRATDVFELLISGFDDLSPLLAAEDLVRDPERREEFIRHCLLKLDLHPRDEKNVLARARYEEISSIFIKQRKEEEEERLQQERELEESRLSSMRTSRE